MNDIYYAMSVDTLLTFSLSFLKNVNIAIFQSEIKIAKGVDVNNTLFLEYANISKWIDQIHFQLDGISKIGCPLFDKHLSDSSRMLEIDSASVLCMQKILNNPSDYSRETLEPIFHEYTKTRNISDQYMQSEWFPSYKALRAEVDDTDTWLEIAERTILDQINSLSESNNLYSDMF